MFDRWKEQLQTGSRWETLIWLAWTLTPYLHNELWLYWLPAVWAFIPSLHSSSSGKISLRSPVILWVSWGLCSALWSPEPGGAVWNWLQEVLIILGGIGGGLYLRKKPVGWGILFASSIPVVFLGFIQTVLVNPYPIEWVSPSRLPQVFTRITGTLGNPNLFGEYLCFLLPIALGMVLNGTDVKGVTKATRLSPVVFNPRRGLVFLSLVYGLLLFPTFSRTSWGAVFAGLLCLLRSKQNIRFFLVLVLGLVLITLLQPLYLEVLTGQALSFDQTIRYRFEVWEGTWRLIKNFPYSGVGGGNFSRYYPYLGMNKADHSHNLFLQIMVEKGGFGLFFLFLLLSALFSVPAGSYTERGVRAALLTQVVAGLTEYVWASPLMISFFWLGYGYLMEARDG